MSRRCTGHPNLHRPAAHSPTASCLLAEDPLNHHAAEMLAQDPAGFQALVQQSVHSGATIGGHWFPPATGDRTIAPKAGLGEVQSPR